MLLCILQNCKVIGSTWNGTCRGSQHACLVCLCTTFDKSLLGRAKCLFITHGLPLTQCDHKVTLYHCQKSTTLASCRNIHICINMYIHMYVFDLKFIEISKLILHSQIVLAPKKVSQIYFWLYWYWLLCVLTIWTYNLYLAAIKSVW